jgi:probable HAF family extracellular repeat protein
MLRSPLLSHRPTAVKVKRLMNRVIAISLPIAALTACSDPTGPSADANQNRQTAIASLATSSLSCPPPSLTSSTIQDLGKLPGSVIIKAERINNRGQAVGLSASQTFNATLWTAPGHAVNVSPPRGSYSEALDINNNGVVLVTSGGIGGGNFVWAQGQGFRKLPNPASASFTALALNDGLQVAGTLMKSAMEQQSVIWSQSGGFRNIGTLPGGSASEPKDINNLGQVAGNSNRDKGGLYSLAAAPHAYLWSPGSGMRDLGAPRGFTNSSATAINDRGEVVGYSTSYSAIVAWIWTSANGFRLVGSTSPTLHDEKALGISNAGQVVGESFSNGASHAFIWTASGGTRLLPTFTGRDDAHALGINDRGQIVGQVVTGNRFRAVLWTLSDRAPGGPPVVVQGDDASAESPGMTPECTIIEPVSSASE